uniref:Uncharacterized protein n=1 Tax=Onchocerca volvulus TaxID=6282 RepID=A0A8R1Y1Y5_ONCVO
MTFGRSITVRVLVEMLLMNRADRPLGTRCDVQQPFYSSVESWSVDPSSYDQQTFPHFSPQQPVLIESDKQNSEKQRNKVGKRKHFRYVKAGNSEKKTKANIQKSERNDGVGVRKVESVKKDVVATLRR